MKILQVKSIFKNVFFILCLTISLLQIYYEIDNFLENKIFTSSSIEDVKNAPIHLVFCDSYPIEDRVTRQNKQISSHQHFLFLDSRI